MVPEMVKFMPESLCYEGDLDEMSTNCFKGVVQIFRYHRSAGSIITHRKGRGYCTSDGTPETFSVCSGTCEGSGNVGTEMEPILVLDNSISITTRISLWAKQMTREKNRKNAEPFGDAVIIFPGRNGKPESHLQDRCSIEASGKINGGEAKCQVWSSANPVNQRSEKEKQADEKRPPIRILRDPTKTFIGKARFPKAGSLSTAGSSEADSFRLATRKHKESESWSSSNPRKRLILESSQACFSSSDNNTKLSITEKTSLPGTGLVQKLNLWGWNRLIVKRFNFIKQRLKRALSLRETRSRTSSPDTSPGRADHQGKGDQNCDGSRCRIIPSAEYRGGDGRLGKSFISSSLNESFERYSRLFGNSLYTDISLDHSRSLISRTDDCLIFSRRHEPKNFRRRLSLPELDSFVSFLGELDHQTKATESNGYRTSSPGAGVVGVNDDKRSYAVEIAEERTTSFLNPEDGLASCWVHADANETEVVESPMLEDTARSVDFPHSEGARFDSLNDASELEEVKVATDDYDMEKLIHCYYKLDKKAEANFNFVRDLLELSGLLEANGNYSICLSTNQHQLNHSLLEDLELLPMYDIDSVERKLLFDLVNESLAEICRTSSTCLPSAFHKGKHRILEKVWKRVHWCLSLSPDMSGQSLNIMVAQDMSRGSGTWMHLGIEHEEVGLKIEDLIFDQVLFEAFDMFFLRT